jgi:hypothetical protein
MADEPRSQEELSEEELEAQEAEELPDRETMMMIVEPGPDPVTSAIPWASESEAPDDRYEQ